MLIVCLGEYRCPRSPSATDSGPAQNIRHWVYHSDWRHYYPFGEEITGTANDTYKFADLYRDADTGLDYAMARYQSSTTGRFLTADPYPGSMNSSEPQSFNKYAYVQNDPVNATDPSGLLRVIVPINLWDYWWWEFALGIGQPGPQDPQQEVGGGGGTISELGQERKTELENSEERAEELLEEDEICANWLTGVLQKAARNAGRNNPESYNARTLLDAMSGVNFNVFGNWSGARINAPEGTVGNFLNHHPEVGGVAVGGTVYLSNTFFNNSRTTRLQRGVGMLHETAHVSFRFSDFQLARAAGFQGNDPRDVLAASKYFSEKFESNCHANLPTRFGTF